jgi:DNA-binding NtrC family response regulator
MNHNPKILICDDDEALCYLLKEQLIGENYSIDSVYDGNYAIETLRKKSYDLVLLDLRMPTMSGEEVLAHIVEHYPKLPTIILTAEAEINIAIKCIKLGAYDFKTKPYNYEDLLLSIKRALQHKDLIIKNELLEKQAEKLHPNKIVGESPAIKQLLMLAEKAAKSDSNILIEGETGTGKELLAEFIHYNSSRNGKTFVVINCASLPDQLIESELFGYEKGAFTDAKTSKPGLVEMANGSTLFLDEIGEISLNIQPKLLRFIENGEFRRIGGVNTLTSFVRVIVATNRNLLEEIEKKTFRRDLLFRLNVITLTVPPLRERKDDIPILARHFLQKKSPIRSPKILSPEAEKSLLNYDFPGNVRELEHIIERAIIFSENNLIHPENLFIPKLNNGYKEPAGASINYSYSDVDSIEEIERIHIQKMLDTNNWDRVLTSLKLGISQKTLYSKIKKYKLLQPEKH